MGLGKTLQAICFMEYLKLNSNENTVKNNNQELSLFQQDSKKDFSSLIIVPTSLVYNWKNEILKFAPQNKVGLYLGSNRETYELLLMESLVMIRKNYQSKIFHLLF